MSNSLTYIMFFLQIAFGIICLGLLYKYHRKIKSYEFHAPAKKIALNDKVAHFNFSLNYFKRFYHYFNTALAILGVVLLFDFIKNQDIYLTHFINFIFIFTAFLYITEKKYIHELSRQIMLKILLWGFAVVNILGAYWKLVILPQSIHVQHYLLYIHLITVAASFSFVIAILMHSAVMLSLKKALKNISRQLVFTKVKNSHDLATQSNLANYSKNNLNNQVDHNSAQKSIFFKRDYLPSIEAMESIFLKRLNYLLWALSFVLITGIILIIDLHANIITYAAQSLPSGNLNAIKSHANYVPFYLKLLLSFILWFSILSLKIYQRRYGLATSKLWYISLVLTALWILSYILSHYWL
jgi:hypothetical protein